MHALFLPDFFLLLVELTPHLRNFLWVLFELNFRLLDRKLSMLLLVEHVVARRGSFSFASSDYGVFLCLDDSSALFSVDALEKLCDNHVHVFLLWFYHISGSATFLKFY